MFILSDGMRLVNIENGTVINKVVTTFHVTPKNSCFYSVSMDSPSGKVIQALYDVASKKGVCAIRYNECVHMHQVR